MNLPLGFTGDFLSLAQCQTAALALYGFSTPASLPLLYSLYGVSRPCRNITGATVGKRLYITFLVSDSGSRS